MTEPPDLRPPGKKPSFYRVEPICEASLRVARVRERRLGVPWHYHPEYQLTILLAGSGQRVVGDSITAAQPGDITLLGPNLPHFWDIDRPQRPAAGGRERSLIDAIVVQFEPAIFGSRFWTLPEMTRAVRLLQAATLGLAFSAQVRREAASAAIRLVKAAPVHRLLGLLGLLDHLARDAGARPICSPAYALPHDTGERDRLALVIQRIREHVRQGSEPPCRRELAKIAGMSERTLSRTFHGRMGRTLPQFVNELRVGRARRLLLETSLAVTAVALRCGFRNLSNFNAQFRRLSGRTPHAFRQACRSTLAEWA